MTDGILARSSDNKCTQRIGFVINTMLPSAACRVLSGSAVSVQKSFAQNHCAMSSWEPRKLKGVTFLRAGYSRPALSLAPLANIFSSRTSPGSVQIWLTLLVGRSGLGPPPITELQKPDASTAPSAGATVRRRGMPVTANAWFEVAEMMP